jgi:peptide/nickel transport system permease protein
MLRLLGRRLLLAVPSLVGVTLVAFVVTNTIPIDPILTVLGEKTAENPAAVAVYRTRWGLDQPLPVRYVVYLRNLAQGDFGMSITTRRPVAEDLREFFAATAELTLGAMAVAILIGLPLGVLAAIRKGSWVDHLARLIALLGSSVPVFWLALIALEVFFVRLGVVPGTGRLDTALSPPERITGLLTIDSLLTGNGRALQSALAHLVLPSVVLGAGITGLITRIVRGSLLEVLGADYVRTARAKGLVDRVVIIRHALRNALIPAVTVVGLAFGNLMAGAVLTETTFAWPGIGRYAARAAQGLDFPAIMGVSLIVAVVYLVVNSMVDVLYAVLDPRIRLT